MSFSDLTRCQMVKRCSKTSVSLDETNLVTQLVSAIPVRPNNLSILGFQLALNLYPRYTLSLPSEGGAMNRNVINTNGHTIRNLRNQRGWTQRELASRAGYTERLIRKAEAGGVLGIQTAIDIAEALSQHHVKVSVDDFVLARDCLAATQCFLDAFASHGQGMVEYVKQELSHDFSLRIALFRGTSSLAPSDWFGVSGLHFLLETIAVNFELADGVVDASYTVGDGLVSVRYRQRFWIAGHALDPFWVNLHFRFQSHRIASIDVDYDTLAVSKFLFNMRSDESLT